MYEGITVVFALYLLVGFVLSIYNYCKYKISYWIPVIYAFLFGCAAGYVYLILR